MPVNSQLLQLADLNPGWKVRNNKLRHKSGFTVQKTQANKKWSAWPPSDPEAWHEYRAKRHMKYVPFPDIQPKRNHFETPEAAMLWCLSNLLKEE